MCGRFAGLIERGGRKTDFHCNWEMYTLLKSCSLESQIDDIQKIIVFTNPTNKHLLNPSWQVFSCGFYEISLQI